MVHAYLITTGVLALLAVIFSFLSMGFFYSKRPSELEGGTAELVFQPRWGAITGMIGLGAVTAILAGAIFMFLLLPARKVEEAEEITYKTFSQKVGKTPNKIQFEDRDPRGHFQKLMVSGWELTGAAWFDNDEIWDVTVTRVTHAQGTKLECVVVKRR